MVTVAALEDFMANWSGLILLAFAVLVFVSSCVAWRVWICLDKTGAAKTNQR